MNSPGTQGKERPNDRGNQTTNGAAAHDLKTHDRGGGSFADVFRSMFLQPLARPTPAIISVMGQGRKTHRKVGLRCAILKAERVSETQARELCGE